MSLSLAYGPDVACATVNEERGLARVDRSPPCLSRAPPGTSSNWARYEPLLIARVHAVMSVIAPTATGLRCYVGHECNCYVKTVEWFRGVPRRAARRVDRGN